jgi:hypothetical protein
MFQTVRSMSFRSLLSCTPLLLAGARALEMNWNTSMATNETFSIQAALIDEYNAGNWLSKFDFQTVSVHFYQLLE